MFLHSRRENIHQKLMGILQLYFIPEEIKNKLLQGKYTALLMKSANINCC